MITGIIYAVLLTNVDPFIDRRDQGCLQLTIGLVVLLVAMALMALAVNAAGRLGRRWRGHEAEREPVA